MQDEKETPAEEISKDEMKFLVKTIWKVLQAPSWSKDSLITLGKAIFSKKTLKEMDDKAFNEIWPHIKVMAETLNSTLSEEATKRVTEAIKEAEADDAKAAAKNGIEKKEAAPVNTDAKEAASSEEKTEDAAQ
jgi:hypothetical protein